MDTIVKNVAGVDITYFVSSSGRLFLSSELAYNDSFKHTLLASYKEMLLATLEMHDNNYDVVYIYRDRHRDVISALFDGHSISSYDTNLGSVYVIVYNKEYYAGLGDILVPASSYDYETFLVSLTNLQKFLKTNPTKTQLKINELLQASLPAGVFEYPPNMGEKFYIETRTGKCVADNTGKFPHLKMPV